MDRKEQFESPSVARALRIAEPAPSRLDAVNWSELAAALGERGFGVTRGLLSPEECEQIRGAYAEDRLYRSRVVMARHGFGRGEYKYSRIRCLH